MSLPFRSLTVDSDQESKANPPMRQWGKKKVHKLRLSGEAALSGRGRTNRNS